MEDSAYLYKMIVWTGLIIPNCRVIKFISTEEVNKIKSMVAEMLDGNALCIVDNKKRVRCIDRTQIRNITIKQIKKI